MAEAGSVWQAIYWTSSGAGMLISELLHKFRKEQGAIQTHFNRFLLCQPWDEYG